LIETRTNMHFLCQGFFGNKASQSLPPKIYESRCGRGELTARRLSRSVSFFLHMLRKLFLWNLYGKTICLNGENEVTFQTFVSLVNFVVTVLILNTHSDFLQSTAHQMFRYASAHKD